MERLSRFLLYHISKELAALKCERIVNFIKASTQSFREKNDNKQPRISLQKMRGRSYWCRSYPSRSQASGQRNDIICVIKNTQLGNRFVRVFLHQFLTFFKAV